MQLITINNLVGNPKWILLDTGILPNVPNSQIDYTQILLHATAILRIVKEENEEDGVNIIFTDGSKTNLRKEHITQIGSNSSITDNTILFNELQQIIINSGV